MEAKKMAAQHAKNAQKTHTGGARKRAQKRRCAAASIIAAAMNPPTNHTPTTMTPPTDPTPSTAAAAPAHRPEHRPEHRPDSGFSYSRPFFEELVDRALAHAKKLGATDAAAEASEGCGLSVSVRKGELENVERNRDKSLGVTVYMAHRRGQASTSDFSTRAIEQTVQAAYDIARFTAEDPMAGLPDEADIAPPASHRA